VIDGACSVFLPIFYSRSDTAETVGQILDHNAKLEAYCAE
jgi:hypothetical protein